MISAFDCQHAAPAIELRSRLGGKGLGLWVMTKELGLNVPPGVTIETSVCAAHLVGAAPLGLEAEVRQHVATLERRLGRVFGGPGEPLIVSVRSGAAASMPGMMDTLLNVGLTPTTTRALAEISKDPKFAAESYRRFLHAYGTTVLGVPMGAHPSEGGSLAQIEADISHLREQIASVWASETPDDP